MRLFLLLLCVLCVSSCSVLPPLKVSPSSTYTITQWPKNTVNAAASQHSVSHKTLLVTTPIASPGYVSSRMIYVMIPYQLRSFSNHAWIAPPADLLLPLIANRLRANHYFKAVVTTPFSGAANIELNTQLLTLQQEFLQPQSVVRLTMEATLLDTASGHVIASHVFTAVVSAPGNNPYSGVLATNQAAHNVVSQIAKFVVNSVG